MPKMTPANRSSLKGPEDHHSTGRPGWQLIAQREEPHADTECELLGEGKTAAMGMPCDGRDTWETLEERDVNARGFEESISCFLTRG